MDEVHYVSTIPYNDKMVETDLSWSTQCQQVTGNKTVAVLNTSLYLRKTEELYFITILY